MNPQQCPDPEALRDAVHARAVASASGFLAHLNQATNIASLEPVTFSAVDGEIHTVVRRPAHPTDVHVTFFPNGRALVTAIADTRQVSLTLADTPQRATKLALNALDC